MPAPGELFYGVATWVMFAATLAVLLGAGEAGYRLGARFLARTSDPIRSQIGTIQAAMFGLLGLLLAFTFAMAAQRYDARKQLVLQESNAIGTTYLRARLLPEPERAEARRLLRAYVDERLRLNDGESERLHAALWDLAAKSAERDARSVSSGLFIASLNEVIDLHSKRAVAIANHVPESILVLLHAVAALAVGLMGYGCGLGGRRALLPNAIAAVLIAAVMLVIIDLDRPARGLITVSQKSMLELRDSLKRAP